MGSQLALLAPFTPSVASSPVVTGFAPSPAHPGSEQETGFGTNAAEAWGRGRGLLLGTSASCHSRPGGPRRAPG